MKFWFFLPSFSDKLLWLDPSKRIDADAALNHDFFWTDPMPCSLEKMLSNHAQSMFGGQGPAGGQNHPHHPHGKAGGHHEGYKDMVY